jgi:basic membrane lipoprotein Med (substrate-binding protein (PBP1-ABC) superfamily)
MKLSRILLVIVIVALAMTVSVVAQDEDVFRVAAIAPSATNDLAFSQSMYDALVAMQEERGEENFQFDFQDSTFIVDDAAVALRDWASSGDYDLVIAHGSQFGSVVEELAAEFPEVIFAWGTDENTFGLENVYAYTAASDQGGYVEGVLAASLTETGVIGVVGPIEVGDAKLYVDGFVQAVADTNEDVTVNVVYIESFSDVPLATEAANTHIANDADILTGTAQMVVGPIAVAIDNDALWFGTQSSQDELAEDIGVAYQVYDWTVVLDDIIANIDDGIMGGEAYVLTLENEGLLIEFDEDYELSEELMTLAEETIQGIIDGDIMTLPEAEEAE